MTASLRVTIPPALDASRVDRALAELLELPVNAVRRLLVTGRVRVEGRVPKKGDPVRAGARVEVSGSGAWLVPGPSLDPIYVDADVVIVDKPAGIPCHPLVPGEGGTVVDAIVAAYPEVASASEDPREGGLVHRLDTGTSGCLAVARGRASWQELREAFSQGRVPKTYLALVEGRVTGALRLDEDLVHDRADPRRMQAVRAGQGQSAATNAVVLSAGPAHSLLRVTVVGGRRHQIRTHLAAAGHPLVGDDLYGASPSADTPWHLLHADSIELPGRPAVRAPLPASFRKALSVRGLPAPDGDI